MTGDYPAAALRETLATHFGGARMSAGAATDARRPTRSTTRLRAAAASRSRRRGTAREYQRDRDRIVHSTAFRRLVYKTQVFVNHEGDLYRTRLTHSLEVAQIARTVARALGLNEPLTEAICLAHDLGHTPFGHAGQDALNECMREFGGFEHNLQSLRVVDELEERYAEFPGLNLTFETREGILKHCSAANARQLGELGERFLAAPAARPRGAARESRRRDRLQQPRRRRRPARRARSPSTSSASWRSSAASTRLVTGRYPRPRRRAASSTRSVRRMIDYLVNDLIDASAASIAAARPRTSTPCARGPSRCSGSATEVRGRAPRAQALPARQHLYRHYACCA